MEHCKNQCHEGEKMMEHKEEKQGIIRRSDTNVKTTGSNSYLMIGLIVFLLLFSLGQAFQIAGLNKALTSNSADDGINQIQSVSPSNSASNAAQKTAGLPTMVGGC